MSTYRIQVFRISDNEQIYGLHCSSEHREQRLAEAKALHKPSKTILIDENITAEISLLKVYDKRKSEYPSIEELTVALFEKDVVKIAELELKRQQVKAKYPKV